MIFLIIFLEESILIKFPGTPYNQLEILENGNYIALHFIGNYELILNYAFWINFWDVAQIEKTFGLSCLHKNRASFTLVECFIGVGRLRYWLLFRKLQGLDTDVKSGKAFDTTYFAPWQFLPCYLSPSPSKIQASICTAEFACDDANNILIILAFPGLEFPPYKGNNPCSSSC